MRARRPSDLVLVLLGVLVLTATVLVAPGPTEIGVDVARLVQASPQLVGWFWEIGYDFLLLWALFLMLAAATRPGRRRLLTDQVAAALLTLAVAVVAGLAAGSTWDSMRHALLTSDPPGAFPAVRVAVLSAVVVVSSPHLVRPLRRIGRWTVGVAAVAVVAIDLTTTLGALAGLCAGVVGAATVHLVLGSPGGRPPLDEVAAELAELGLEVVDVRHATLQRRGVALAVARAGADGRPLVVKVYGRDAWEGQLISSLWTRLWYRVDSPSGRVGRLQQVEHEAFVTLLAQRAGVPVLPVVVAGMAWERDGILVTEAGVRPLVAVAADEVDDELLRRCWRALVPLHAAGITHGNLTAHAVVVRAGGAVALTDLARGATSASAEQRATDRAQLLVATALVAGPQRAVRVALDETGAGSVGELLPYLQPAVLDLETRKAVRTAGWDTSDLREAASAATGEAPPKLERLHRVSVGSLLMMLVLVLVAYAVISAVAGIGWSTLVEEFQGAQLQWVAVALLLSPLIPVGTAFATLGASVRDVPFGPVLALQYAVQFIALAVPSTAARLALEIRFFERFGVDPTGAVSIGLIDSVSGFVVQIVLILLILASGLVTLHLGGATSTTPDTSSSSTSGSSVDMAAILVVAAIVLVVLVVLVVAIPRVRRFVVARAADGRVALRVLRSPRKVALLLAGNLSAQLLQAAALSLCVTAFGYHVPFAAAVLVNTAAALFGGLMPVPGGVGVVEAALTAGLVAVGVPDTPALSAAVMYRVVTFYLPPLWGGFSMRWLRRHEYV